MIKNYLKIAWRNLKKQPFFTFLNVTGLAIGMTGALLIGLYIHDELSYDTMFADAEHIYRINVDVKFGGAEENLAEGPAPLAATLKQDYPVIEDVTRLRAWGSWMLRKAEADENVKEDNITFADANFFDLFGIPFLAGDATTALKEPNTLVLTQQLAVKHFGKTDVVGQSLLINDTDVYRITGVIEDMPKNSMFQNRSLFISMLNQEESKSDSWGNHNFPTFVKLKSGAKKEDLQLVLDQLLGKYVIPWAQVVFPGMTQEQFEAAGNYLNYSFMPITDVHLYSHQSPELSPTGDINNIYILGAIGLFLILLASVNFMNLSTAYSLKRAKEVGIRKTLGSEREGLIAQFLTESGMVSFIALLIAIVLTFILLPFFNNLSGKTLSIPFLSPLFWTLICVLSLVLGLLSGSYPAFFLSRFLPARVLKGGGEKSVGGGKIRNTLVVFQFATSVFLMVCTLVVYQQINYIRNKDVGFQKEQMLVINDLYNFPGSKETFKKEVRNLPLVDEASLSSYLPTPSSRSSGTLMIKGRGSTDDAINAQQWEVDFDYIQTLGLQMVAGRNFDPSLASDSSAIVINESTVKLLNTNNPGEVIGKQLTDDFSQEEVKTYTIIGVVKDFNYQSLREGIGALALKIGSNPGKLLVRLQPGDFSKTINDVKSLWTTMAKGQPFNYYFMDDSFIETYEAEQKLGRIFISFTILSIIIACLGLFGLAAFNAEKRVKEIGVRKVMGASVFQLVTHLSFDFLKLVSLGIIVALPVGWVAMNKWLEDFSFRTDISVWIFVFAAGISVLISLLTVSYQSIKAAVVNPVKSLRSE